MTSKILVIEDETYLQNGLKIYLENASYSVDVASDGLEGVQKFQNEEYDLVLLDVMLPKIDGYSVLEIIREKSNVPVIMITALSQDKDQIKGFDLKVDDYIVKPFTMQIVLKRIEALLRRTSHIKIDNSPNFLNHEQITINLDSCEVLVANKKMSLTHKEFELLKIFLENPNQVFTREQLLDKIWGIDFFGNGKVVNAHIKNLRQKIELDYIKTVRGVGYKLDK